MALLDSDYVVFTETIASVFFGWAAGDVPRRYAALLRESQTHGEARRAAQSMASLDSRPFLSDVRAPTLICHHRGASLVPIEVLRDLSSGIPNASLVVMEGETVAGDINSPQMREAVDEFLLGAASVPSVVPPLASATVDAAATAGGTFRTILFTDVEGSTAITQRLGDEGAREVLREHERIVREALKAHGGAEVKTMGDGFMASFASATKALECAIAIQKAIQEWNQTARGEPVEPRAEEIRVRIGLNAGEPIAEADDLFGTAVNMAARIAAKAEGGEILVSDVVRQLLAGKGFVFADRGEMPLKGFEEPVRLFEVRWTT
ncbi:MAG: adenylate/guanylate cyclase domain-containing protein [Chloroflexi bacterium]|nr:adenylate/guanylate cyclase domain-containing protein [Chloroflexota bacterium]